MANQDLNKKETLREFGLTSLAVDNGISVFLLTFMILLFGIQSYQTIPKEQFPEVDFPTVYINTPYPGNSAVDIENLVTRPLETELQSVDDVEEINSTSIQDFSVITIEFSTETDIDEAVRRIKDAVDKAKPELPNDLPSDPTILDINLSEIPIVVVNVAGDYTNDELRDYAEYLQDEIEEVNEINRVELQGALEREVKVDVDLPEMEARQVNFTDIENAIASENVTLSGGEIVKNDFRRAIRVKGEFEEVSEMEDIIVKSENLNPIYLKDIAEVTFGYKERTSIARADGLPVISLNVIKKQGENLLAASDKLKAKVEEAKAELPDNLEITYFNDQSINTRNEVQNLENSIISGVILVVLVLLFFLGLRNASFVGLAIPLSMLMGILILNLTGTTLNIVVLFALILALGLLVDNGIVVVENIYRYMQEGANPIDAARYGAGEVAVPIIASTATTLAAFVPLAFWPGLIGEFMKYFPLTLIIVLTSSLFVALVINPVFTATFMKIDERADDPAVRKRRRRNVLIFSGVALGLALIGFLTNVVWLRNLMLIVGGVSLFNFFVLRPGAFSFQNNLLPRLENAYDHFVRWAVRKSGLVFGSTVILLFLSMALFVARQPPIVLFPTADPLYVNVFLEMPLGTDIEATDRVVKRMEDRIQEAVEPYGKITEAVLTQIGENTSDPNAPPEPGSSPNKARITISFVPAKDRGELSTVNAMEDIRRSVQGVYPGAQIVVDQNASGPATGKPINLEVQSENLDKLLTTSSEIISYFNDANIPGIDELKADVQVGKPELIVNVDRDAARRYGVSTFQIADAIRTAVYGKEVSKYKVGEDEYDIFVRLDEKYRYNVDDLLNQRITFRSASSGRIVQVPISAVADTKYTSTYSAIKRKDLERVVTIYSNVVEGYNANEIVNQLDEMMQSYDLPEGFNYEFTGEQEQQEEDSAFLSTAFLIAVFAIFIILVAQFNSITAPFIIILSVLFSTIGVLIGYATTGMDFVVVFTGVGIISLAGVVVNNAIVLIDYINLLVKRKQEELGFSSIYDMKKRDVREAIIRAGATRLRPVLLTAITTVLGLVPLAVGFNFNFFTLITESDPKIFIGGDNTALWGPMAWTVIYGLIFATFLTLVVIPVMYWLFYRLQAWARRAFNGGSGRDSSMATV